MVDAMADRRATETHPALLVAIELSKASWLLAVHDPTTDKISRHRIGGGDATGLIALIAAAHRGAERRAGGPIEAECVFEAGYDGFWLQPRYFTRLTASRRTFGRRGSFEVPKVLEHRKILISFITFDCYSYRMMLQSA